MVKKIVFIILSMSLLIGCSNKTKDVDEDKLKILAVNTNQSEEYFSRVYNNLILGHILDYKSKKGVEVELKKLEGYNLKDVKNKLATKIYTEKNYDIIIFGDDEIRSNFEREDVMEKINSLEVYDDIFNSIKNDYFVPLAYKYIIPVYPNKLLEELSFNLNERQKYGENVVDLRIARKEKVRPAKLEMIREAKNLELNYNLDDESLKIDLESVKKFRDEFREILLENYELSHGSRKDYIKEKFGDKTNDWRGIKAVYSRDFGTMLRDIFDTKAAEQLARGEYNNNNTLYKQGEGSDIFYLKPNDGYWNMNIFTWGVLKESDKKEEALDFINSYLKKEEKRILDGDYSNGNFKNLILKSNLEVLSEKESEFRSKEIIDLRNKSVQFLDGELGEWIKYEIVTDEYIKEHVMYAIRPYILDDYNEEEVKRRIEAFEKQVNVILAEKH